MSRIYQKSLKNEHPIQEYLKSNPVTITTVENSDISADHVDDSQSVTNKFLKKEGLSLFIRDDVDGIETDIIRIGSAGHVNVEKQLRVSGGLTTLSGGLLVNDIVEGSECIINVPVQCTENLTIGYTESGVDVIDNLGIHITSRPVDDTEFTGANLNFYMNTNQPEGTAASSGDDNQVNGSETPLGSINFYGYDNGSYRCGAKIVVEPTTAWSNVGDFFVNKNNSIINFFAEDGSDSDNTSANPLFQINGDTRKCIVKTNLVVDGSISLGNSDLLPGNIYQDDLNRLVIQSIVSKAILFQQGTVTQLSLGDNGQSYFTKRANFLNTSEDGISANFTGEVTMQSDLSVSGTIKGKVAVRYVNNSETLLDTDSYVLANSQNDLTITLKDLPNNEIHISRVGTGSVVIARPPGKLIDLGTLSKTISQQGGGIHFVSDQDGNYFSVASV